MVVIMYEGTMLAAVIFTVLGAIFESRLPRFTREIYDTRITDGYIGVLVHSPEDRVDSAAAAMRAAGAEDVRMADKTREKVAQPARANRKGARA